MKQSKTILIVEDDPQLRDVYALSLEMEGHHVIEASNGKDALFKLIDNNKLVVPDCIVLDMKMPIMSGETFLEIIRTSSQLRLENVPVIVCSGFEQEDKTNSIFASLSKQISVDQFVNTVEASFR